MSALRDLKIIFLKNQKNVFLTQLTFACSKSTVETLEKGVKYVQS